MSRSLHVAFVATECFPFSKVGGLADVVGSLPRALEGYGIRVDVVMPAVPGGNGDPSTPRGVDPLTVRFNDDALTASVHQDRLPNSGVRVFSIADGHYFPRPSLYIDPSTGADYADQAERWAFFQQAALALLARESPDLDLIHCHEHQTALIPLYLREPAFRGVGPPDLPVVLTIHNLGYQGIFPPETIDRLGLPGHLANLGGSLEFYGQVNFMKGGILASDALTVVSPTYAREIQTAEFGHGLEGVIAERHPDLFGILNGIDDVEWNPETDTHIESLYSRSNTQGKTRNRRQLIAEFRLDEAGDAAPILAMVSRIDAHKGFDLLLEVLEDILQQGARFVLVGTGDRSIESRLRSIADAFPGRAAIRFAFDNTLAHRVIAGADIFLMPSRYEPCGLTQMYALRYGAVPVVRATGGLADTVEEFDPETGEGTGFRFSAYDADQFRRAIEKAVHTWHGPSWERIIQNGMARDFSWSASAKQYIEVYEHAIGKRRETLT